jgi:hypothetical protein
LEPVARRILHKPQTIFIQGRNIMNTLLAIHEIFHETKGRRETGVILKLDLEKAYDKVHWDLLLRCLKDRGLATHVVIGLNKFCTMEQFLLR